MVRGHTHDKIVPERLGATQQVHVPLMEQVEHAICGNNLHKRPLVFAKVSQQSVHKSPVLRTLTD